MSSIDDLLLKAKNAASAAGKKTGELLEVSKLKMRAAELRSDLNDVYLRLGKLAYREGIDCKQPGALAKVLFAEIEELDKRLTEVLDQIAQIKKTLKCPNCGTQNDAQAFYCSRCGCSLNREKEPSSDGKQPE